MRTRTESPDEVVQRRQSALKSAKERIQPVADRLRPRLEGNAGALAALDSLLAGEGGEYVELPIPKGKRKPIGAILSNIKTVYDALGYSSQDAYDKAHLLSGVHHASEELKKEIVARSVHTRFYKNSSALDGAKGKPYWSTQWEMFARAFESWVMDALAEKGLFNNYLVRADKQDQGDNSDSPYPGGEERQLINGAIAKLAALRDSGAVAGAAGGGAAGAEVGARSGGQSAGGGGDGGWPAESPAGGGDRARDRCRHRPASVRCRSRRDA